MTDDHTVIRLTLEAYLALGGLMWIVQLLTAAALSGASISCPSAVSDTQNIELPPGADSIRYFRGPRKLESMAAFVGHPDNLGQIQPIETDDLLYVWTFAPSQDIWIECSYQNSAAIVRFHVGPTRKCTFSKSRGDLDGNAGGCEAAAL
jgi:hypothetical protein